MTIKILNADTGQYLRTLSEENMFNLCGKDKRMYDDYIRHIKGHPYIKKLNELWFINE